MSEANKITIPASIAVDSKMDSNLLQKVRDGDSCAFEKLYHRYYRPVYGFIFKATRSRIETEDIIQEVFANLWVKRELIEPDRNFKALLFTVVRRAAIDLFRRSSRTSAIFSDDESEGSVPEDVSPENIFEQSETKLLLQIAIENMPKRQREVFSLHYYESLSPNEIADRLDLSYDNVRKHIYNGKRQLREVVF